jgi:FG-GAP repeat
VILCYPSVLATPAAAAMTPAKPYDFNGDGYVDLAIGVPRDRVGGKDGAGTVNVQHRILADHGLYRTHLWRSTT